MPIVAELADKYTGKESTSITYEKARQLMEAVLYCIHEYEADAEKRQELISVNGKTDAKMVYRLGYETVLRNVKETQILYNKIIPDFKYYETGVIMIRLSRESPPSFCIMIPVSSLRITLLPWIIRFCIR